MEDYCTSYNVQKFQFGTNSELGGLEGCKIETILDVIKSNNGKLHNDIIKLIDGLIQNNKEFAKGTVMTFVASIFVEIANMFAGRKIPTRAVTNYPVAEEVASEVTGIVVNEYIRRLPAPNIGDAVASRTKEQYYNLLYSIEVVRLEISRLSPPRDYPNKFKVNQQLDELSRYVNAILDKIEGRS